MLSPLKGAARLRELKASLSTQATFKQADSKPRDHEEHTVRTATPFATPSESKSKLPPLKRTPPSRKRFHYSLPEVELTHPPRLRPEMLPNFDLKQGSTNVTNLSATSVPEKKSSFEENSAIGIKEKDYWGNERKVIRSTTRQISSLHEKALTGSMRENKAAYGNSEKDMKDMDSLFSGALVRYRAYFEVTSFLSITFFLSLDFSRMQDSKA